MNAVPVEPVEGAEQPVGEQRLSPDPEPPPLTEIVVTPEIAAIAVKVDPVVVEPPQPDDKATEDNAERSRLGRKVKYLEESLIPRLEGKIDQLISQKTTPVVTGDEFIPPQTLDEFERLAEKSAAEVKIISTETREGVQLKELGEIAAILRFAIY